MWTRRAPVQKGMGRKRQGGIRWLDKRSQAGGSTASALYWTTKGGAEHGRHPVDVPCPTCTPCFAQECFGQRPRRPSRMPWHSEPNTLDVFTCVCRGLTTFTLALKSQHSSMTSSVSTLIRPSTPRSHVTANMHHRPCKARR